VYWLNRNGTVSSVSREKFENKSPLEFKSNDIILPQVKVSQVLAVGSDLQPFPGKFQIKP